MVCEGYAYLAKTKGGTEFILASSFGRSRKQAKKHLGITQNNLCVRSKPMFNIVGLCAVRMEAVQIDEEGGEPPPPAATTKKP